MNTRQVRVNEGLLEGEETLSYAVFRGVPYARPPVGDLRWKRPEPPKAWEGIRQAVVFQNRAVQNQKGKAFYQKEFYADPEFLPPMSEDCLYLNIWTPVKKKAEDGAYPVAVWIHGGAFLGGYGSEIEFDGAEFAKRGIILVTINYRLGPLGFLALPQLALEDPAQTTGNYGILDQIAALRWVKENIASFGGDPDRVTVFGQSAGAVSVQTLCNSPLGRGLFARAIMQSGGGMSNGLARDLHREEAYRIGEMLMRSCRCDRLSQMRELPAEVLCKKTQAVIGKIKGLPFSPMCDEYVLPGTYDENIRAGRIADTPYLLGSNANDILVRRRAVGRPGGKLYQGCIDWALAREETSEQKTYIYYFNRALPGDRAGAFHSAELWYVFGTLARSWRPFEEWDYEISDAMICAWCNFIKYGDPNGREGCGSGDWKPYRREDPFIRDFG